MPSSAKLLLCLLTVCLLNALTTPQNALFVSSFHLPPTPTRRLSSTSAVSRLSSTKNPPSVSVTSSLPPAPPLSPPPPLAPRPLPRLYYHWKKSNLKLNLFGCYYGFVAISLGFIWFAVLKCIRLWTLAMGKLGITVDEKKGAGIRTNAIWGWFVLRLSYNWPLITGKKRVQKLLKVLPESSPGVMYVANHCSWMDIPYIAMSIGIRKNYKIIAKSELLKVPILGEAISVGENITVDRSSRKSQVKTYKDGLRWLKDGVSLCTFPEGTRSRDGRLQAFKRGAFKMAEKTGAVIVPISISYCHILNPVDWVFPVRPARGIPVRVHVHDPIETVGKTEDEIVEVVQKTLCSALPESQQPLDGKMPGYDIS
ncbi:hypothetical protein TrVE_jg5253 [Triparma verrucosa]|uniref:1-acyl-sn-glycerol-3-phosphate acyltransferase n=2 Tax=Triparma TaxID=722752 RepID=A0A9W7EGT0_9STRA|nr:hypothetical protein TrST_g2953 [Triparma strigata]GMH84737.1 hypothetical protein TrVE_jg5253 [Triparma verrucosa]